MNLPDFSVRRPVTIIMFFLGILLLGSISWQKLPQELFPPITFPQISVITYYANAAPEEIETLITRPIEESIGSVAGLKHIYSRSREGMSVVTIAFEWDIKIDFAALAVREKIDLIKERLPVESDDPLVVKFNPLERPILILSVTGGNDLMELREISRRALKDNLEKVEGVASASISGGLEREIIVEIDQARLSAANTSILSVVDSISQANVNYPAGTIKKGLYEYLIRTVGEFRTVDELNYVVVSIDDVARFQAEGQRREYVEKQDEGPRESADSQRVKEMKGRTDKRLVLLKDIATIKDTIKERTSISRYNGKENVSISIQKQAGYNTIKVVESVLAKIAELRAKELPKNVNVEVIYDHSTFIRNAIRGIRDSAVQGGILAFLILLVFLRNLRPAVIVTLAIPLSIMGTFFLMFCLGLSINMMTLGGLALGVGMMVDNAIVVIENIFRYRQLGIGPKAAAIVGTNEVFAAIFSSTLTSIAVFLPLILFVPGISGQLFKELSWTVIFSLVMSLIVAVTLVPLLAVGIKMKKLSTEEVDKRKDVATHFSNLPPARRKVLGTTIILIVAGVFFASMFLVQFMEVELLPRIDQGQFIIRVDYPTGTVLDVTHYMVDKVENIVLGHPDVESTAVSIGAARGTVAAGAALTGPHQGQILVNLKQDRKLSSQEVIDELRAKMSGVADDKVKIQFIMQESEFQFLATGGKPIVVQVKGYDPIMMDRLVDQVKENLGTIKGVVDVEDDRSESFPETKVLINKEKAALYAISVSDISLTAKMALDGAIATKFKEAGQETQIRVQLQAEDRKDFMSVGNLLIRSPLLNTVIPLREVSKIVKGLGPSEIKRVDQERTVLVLANIAKGYSKKDVIDNAKQQVDKIGKELIDFRVQMAGESAEVEESNRKFMFALILSIILIYMIMASQFESLFQPFIVMFTVPLSIIGVVTALFITNTSISAVVLLGVIMLGGIVVNNGIVLIEYINILREAGEGIVTAAEKASVIRFRPIMMSALTSIFGLLPLALGLGDGAELRAPMAIAVMGGLITSTFLTLFVIPLLYIFFNFLLKSFAAKEASA
ncbi:MAG: efflux RND transporter permease subunit [Candidatus Omnitrophica bacterium]|nr:efflux RND transporter permease subunit [Candidatus Omnitrophota bacterium]